MPKYEIYQNGKVPPLTTIEADRWDIWYGEKHDFLRFHEKDGICAEFILNNIAGFKEIKE